MNVILLSGGSGKRLWPLSNEIRSKQFIKIFKNGSDYESMVQRVYHQIKMVDPYAEVTVATSKSQISALHNQLGQDIGISLEPCRRDTFPAIALAVAFLHDVRDVPENEAVVVCPVDPYVEESYFHCLADLYAAARKDEHNLTLMGIETTYPSEKYGYIIPERDENGNETISFREKPDKATAQQYIAKGALWNGGVFAFKLSYVLEKSRELLGTDRYEELFNNYDKLNKISFDYAVVEQEKSIGVLRYSGAWKDLGTWNTLTEAMEEKAIGNAQMNDDCQNVHIINELSIPILAMGLKDMVISASPEGILVSDKEQSGSIKPYVDSIDQQIMFAEKSWGDYLVLDVEKESMIVKVTMKPENKMNYHSHERRDEIWTVIGGNGKSVVDGEERDVKTGDIIHMKAGQKHKAIAGENGLQMIEVQLGKDITVADKIKYD